MYIPEFWCGVLSVIGIELLVVIIIAVNFTVTDKKRKKNDEKENL